MIPSALLEADADALGDADALADGLADGLAVAVEVEVAVTDGLGVGVGRLVRPAMKPGDTWWRWSALRTFGQAFAPGSWVSGHGS
ncbi:hypothetical protein GCM10023196_034240 [Actinoallomurus vinaceus]|uniref:Uncharacterized protein n=1 Tax=Actinoallomurus vinaceus TaxID=1080074 RepID=A0ABP8UAA9_9ACTN